MKLTRRRFMIISAVAAAAPGQVLADAQALNTVVWRGTAMGASASIRLKGPDGSRLTQLAGAVQSEISRLEDIFSLYRSDSQISRLNRNGVLSDPSPEMLEVMSLAGAIHERSSGAFDPTVQSLWQAHADARGMGQRPSPSALQQARDRTGWSHVRFGPAAIRFDRLGMALTFNGIAQGYVTDRIAVLLRAAGLTDLLIDAGEIVALGARPDRTPWRVGIAAPDGRIAGRVGLSDRAMATSAPQGGKPDSPTHVGHIIDPRTGHPGGHWNLVSVSDNRATIADALSTAICLMDRASTHHLLRAFPTARIEHLS